MGGVSRQPYAATLPPDRFRCLLDELPLHLIPQRGRRVLCGQGQVSGNTPLFMNPECRLLPGGQAPEQFADCGDLLERFAQQFTIAWVRDPVSEYLLPFWLSPRLESVVRDLKPGEPAPATLPSDMRSLLSAAGILIPHDYTSLRQWEWEEVIRKSGPRFRQKGYVPVPDLIHPFHVAALRRYYRYLIRTGAIELGDRQSSRRYVAYNEPVARFFHRAITARLSALAREPVKPSYVYLASYLSGTELRKHTDREQCEFSVTFCLDFSPEPELETPWPIQLETPAGTVTVYQALGDGLAYRGTRLPHYRRKLKDGQTSTSIFFHYVPADFAGSLD